MNDYCLHLVLVYLTSQTNYSLVKMSINNEKENFTMRCGGELSVPSFLFFSRTSPRLLLRTCLAWCLRCCLSRILFFLERDFTSTFPVKKYKKDFIRDINHKITIDLGEFKISWMKKDSIIELILRNRGCKNIYFVPIDNLVITLFSVRFSRELGNYIKNYNINQ